MTPSKLLYGQIVFTPAIIIGAVWGATQWAADELGYQSGLGPAWITFADYPIYPPWRLFEWWYAYEAYAPSVFNKAGAMAAGGGIVGVIVAIASSLWRARQNQLVTTYGSSCWANKDQIAKSGLFDPNWQEGYVYIGQSLWDAESKSFTSNETPEFAAENVLRWWRDYGIKRYPGADEILILADAGGSNSYRSRVWKMKLQELLCKQYGLEVTVCHFPPGASKWNPIEHRLFSEITKNWKGTPLTSFETVLKYIRTTRTKTGLKVYSRLVKKVYKTEIGRASCRERV